MIATAFGLSALVTVITGQHWRHARRRGSPLIAVDSRLAVVQWYPSHPPINRGASINHGNVTEVADVRVAAPSPGLVAPGPARGGRANSARRLTIEAAVDL
jgi:hypothetical protein